MSDWIIVYLLIGVCLAWLCQRQPALGVLTIVALWPLLLAYALWMRRREK